MAKRERGAVLLEEHPLWYKDAIIYEAHVRTFFDSNDDGVGDFPGLTAKLDYLQDLGVTAIWLLPFYPSPWKDDGYDIADYRDVHPAFGTVRDFRTFLNEAHRRGLRVITELVINHTSDQHPWFQRSRRARPGSRWRDFYVWSDTPDRYREARIIFQDFESSNWAWDPVAQQYYWHRFYSQQPDLNYDNPEVHRAIFNAMDFWFRMGVDGMRLDAVPYLYEREGTNCENLPETHAFLRALRRHVDENFPDRMLLAEANQWPEDAVAYFGAGDECHMAFHFPVMPRLYMAVQMEDRFPIIDILEQTPPTPPEAQWAVFLRNHDELTLEMVTDEERDYMYQVYAHDPQMRVNVGIRRRLAPLLGNNRRKIELMKGLLFSLPGTPVLYYGDEIGMGDNFYLGDRNGVRTPMQWSGDRNAGFSRANPQRLYLPVIIDPEYHYETVNVETQQNNPSSLLWWTKRAISLRKRFRAMSRGTIEFLHPENRKVLAFIRSWEHERILVLANLSRLVQPVELELGGYEGMRPVELSGQTPFPPIGREPYFLSLGPYAIYWFALEPKEEPLVLRAAPAGVLEVPAERAWVDFASGPLLGQLQELLPAYVRERRWFRGKARTIREIEVREVIPVRAGERVMHILLVSVGYTEGDPEVYVLPLAHATGAAEKSVRAQRGDAVIAQVQLAGKPGILYDASVDPAFAAALLELIGGRRRLRGQQGVLRGSTTPVYRRTLNGREAAPAEPARVEQTNTSFTYGDVFFLKLYRRLEAGENPDVEMSRFLTEHGFPYTPALAGTLEYRRGSGRAAAAAMLQERVESQGDAWSYTLDALDRYFENALAVGGTPRVRRASTAELLQLAGEPPTPEAARIGAYLQSVQLLGRRTAQMHAVLASDDEERAFAPEPFSVLYQRSLYQSLRNSTGRAFRLLARQAGKLPEPLRAEARRALAQEADIQKRLRQVTAEKIEAVRIRCHGDYHLGQVLYTGKDFIIIDFEGEPARPLGERRLKRPALYDVAGMLRSFHYAVSAALMNRAARSTSRESDTASLEPWARCWYQQVAAGFLRAYLAEAGDARFLPRSQSGLEVLLDVLLLEKALYEVGYELNNRPDWLWIPLAGIRELVGE